MIVYYLCLLVMTLLGSVASLFLKRASSSDGLRAFIMNINLYVGGALYLATAFMNIWILRYLDYSVVLPLTSFTYVWTMGLSYLILKEKITRKKVAGVLLIVVGAAFVSSNI